MCLPNPCEQPNPLIFWRDLSTLKTKFQLAVPWLIVRWETLPLGSFFWVSSSSCSTPGCFWSIGFILAVSAKTKGIKEPDKVALRLKNSGESCKPGSAPVSGVAFISLLLQWKAWTPFNNSPAGRSSKCCSHHGGCCTCPDTINHLPHESFHGFPVSATPAFLLQDKGMDNPLQTPRVSVFPVWGFTEAVTQCKGPAIMSVFLCSKTLFLWSRACISLWSFL